MTKILCSFISTTENVYSANSNSFKKNILNVLIKNFFELLKIKIVKIDVFNFIVFIIIFFCRKYEMNLQHNSLFQKILLDTFQELYGC